MIPGEMDPGKDILLLLVTDFRGLIPQRIMAWDGYDLERIKGMLGDHGVAVAIVGAHEIDFRAMEGRKRVAAIYASSQEPRYKQYLQDVVANLHGAGVYLVPALEHMLAHEDKAFQAIRLARTGVRAPRGYAFGNREHAYDFLRSASYPLVGKTAAGFGSEGVRLLRDESEGRRFVRKNMIYRALRKGRSLFRRGWERLAKPSPVLGLVVFQELIPNLEGDWKILIWGNVACGVYRENRRNDFRASGSGKVRFLEVPVPVLEFAHEALGPLDLPWASLDIGYDGRECHLLEYQGLHFGLTAAEKGSFHYVRKGAGEWIRVEGKIDVESEMARIALDRFRRLGWM